MNDAQRRTAILSLIERHAAHTINKSVARKSLIDEGIYTQKGALRVAFGGKSKKEKTAA